MMAEESSALRSVKSVVICGVVTRMMTNAKKPISAAVTATIAINREAPNTLRKLTRLCKPTAPQIRSQSGSDHWAIIAYGMVSIWLTKVNGWSESSKRQKSASQSEVDFYQIVQTAASGSDHWRYC